MITKMNYEDKYRHYHSIGDTETANDYARLADLELQVADFQNLLDDEYEHGFNYGVEFNKAQYTKSNLYSLQEQNKRLIAEKSKIRTNLNILLDWFSSDEIKTVAGRKELAKTLRSYIMNV